MKKRCPKCEVEYTDAEEHFYRKASGELCSWCKRCMNKASNQWRRAKVTENRADILAYSAALQPGDEAYVKESSRADWHLVVVMFSSPEGHFRYRPWNDRKPPYKTFNPRRMWLWTEGEHAASV